MTDSQRYWIMNREVIKLGKEAQLDRLFREWVYPDLLKVAPEFMATAKTFRPVGGGTENAVYFTAQVDREHMLNYGAFVRQTMLDVRSEAEVNALYAEFCDCLESINRLSLVEVMTDENPSISIGGTGFIE